MDLPKSSSQKQKPPQKTKNKKQKKKKPKQKTPLKFIQPILLPSFSVTQISSLVNRGKILVQCENHIGL